MTKSNLGGVVFQLIASPSIEVMAGTDTEAMEECYLPSWSPWLAQDHQPKDSTAHSEQGPFTSIINQEDEQQINLVGMFSQLRFSLPKWLWFGPSWHKTSQHKVYVLLILNLGNMNTTIGISFDKFKQQNIIKQWKINKNRKYEKIKWPNV